MKVKICSSCGMFFWSKGHNRKYCKRCGILRERKLHHINSKKWNKRHPKHYKEIKRNAQNRLVKTTKGKITKTKTQHKRRRNLGFLPLNKPFVGANAHHIDKNHVIYIPKRLHQTAYHNIWTGAGMDNMNMKAFGFILWNLGVPKHSEGLTVLEWEVD